MIIDIWRPRKKKNVITHYELIKDSITKNKGYKVRYTCDEINCRHKEQINTTTSAILQKNGWNSFKHQMCRSCRSVKSESNKGVTISYSDFKKSIENENYVVLTKKKEYDKAIYPSQFKIKVICSNGHKYYITRNNWNKGKRCKQCYLNKMKEISTNNLQGFWLYRRIIENTTNVEYNKFKNKINPSNLIRGIKKYHLDHKYSVAEGFKNNIPIYIISNYKNLQMLYYKDNIRKNNQCSITKKELFNEYFTKIK